ncbi:hypothetical protein GCM10027347_58660 [Larkinella harenae]
MAAASPGDIESWKVLHTTEEIPRENNQARGLNCTRPFGITAKQYRRMSNITSKIGLFAAVWPICAILTFAIFGRVEKEEIE